jgi:hypothetical protein
MATPIVAVGSFCNVWFAYVLLKGYNGGASKHSSARNVDDGADFDL